MSIKHQFGFFMILILLSGSRCKQLNNRDNLNKIIVSNRDSSKVFLDRQIGKISKIPKSDLNKFRTWEYKIVALKTDDFRVILDTLNQLGSERWDCFWIENIEDDKVFYFKKAPITVTEYIYGVKP